MASLLFTCPITHHQASTGIETDVQTGRLEGDAESEMPALRWSARSLGARHVYRWRAAGCHRPISLGPLRPLGAVRWAKSLGTDSLRRAARSLSTASVLPPRRDQQSQTGRIGADQDQIVACVVIADRRM